MIADWAKEGVGTEFVKIKAGYLPGSYVIDNEDNGERHFYYWRDDSPAKLLISEFTEVFDELLAYDIIFLSGITLSLYPQPDRDLLYAFLQRYQNAGGIVGFDNNYRARNWQNLAEAQANFTQAMAVANIALISFDDELSLWGEHSIQSCVDRWRNAGVDELVIKNGEHGCVLMVGNEVTEVPLPKVVVPIDTTAAGDSFNGGYLAAKQRGENPINAIAAAQKCASIVIQHKGAIVDANIFKKEIS